MAARGLLQSVSIAMKYVNCYAKHTGLTFFIKVTHSFILGGRFGEVIFLSKAPSSLWNNLDTFQTIKSTPFFVMLNLLWHRMFIYNLITTACSLSITAL